ncbi:glycerate kinase [Spongisporangium articulatum]|uniref:Glycerate kinase n=1 Tax=Spongisporangium articulatum TaxID=3362603 RepID=A0ABW8AV66_9ACTN
MRVVIAPDRFRETLSAAEAAAAIATGWRRAAPDDDLVLLPLSDGSAGLVSALGGPPEPWWLAPDGTAYVESAQVSPVGEDPGPINTLGVGALVAAAVDAGARRIVVGLGEVGAVDGGAGLLAGLAAAWQVEGYPAALERLGNGGAALRGVTGADLAFLPALRERLVGVELVGAVDVQLPLLGFKGAAAVEGPTKGADDDLVQRLDAALTDLATAVLAAAQLSDRNVVEPGAGAGGGLGFGVLALGGRLEPGASLVARLAGLPDLLEGTNRAELVVTGEGSLDWQSLGAKVLTAVAETAQARGVPAVAVPGQLLVGRRELLTLGVDGAYPVARTPAEVADALADPAGTLAARAERVARTWSRSG